MQAEIIVIGAGIAGAAVAAVLAAHRSVLLLEQESAPGYHATGRSAALLSESYGNATIRALTRASRDFFLSSEHGAPMATRRGSLYIATQAQSDQLEGFLSLPDVAKTTLRVSAAQARGYIPALRESYVAAAAFESESYDIDVNALHQLYLRELKRLGGRVLCNHGLSRAEFAGGSWLIESGNETIRGSILVDAAGAWGDVVARTCGVAPIGLTPKKRTAALGKLPQSFESSSWPMVIDIGEQFYFRPDAGKLFISPADEIPSEPCDAYADDWDVAVAIDRMQQAAEIPIERIVSSWAGLRTFAPDRTPVVGFDLASPGFFWLVGQGGYGIQTAPALSRLAAALILERPIPPDVVDAGLDLKCLSPGRRLA